MTYEVTEPVLSKREYFAAAALPAIIELATATAHIAGSQPQYALKFWAKLSYEVADAMIAESERKACGKIPSA